MGLSKEEQRAKQIKSRPDDFHPPAEQRKSRPAKRKHDRVVRKKFLDKATREAAADVSGNTKSSKIKRVKKVIKAPVAANFKKGDRSSEAYKKINKVAKKYQATLKKNATKSELFLKGVLEERNIKHKFQEIVVYNQNSKFYILDFVVKKVVIELDGNHHYKGEQLKKDIARDKHLKSIGYKVVRIANSDLYKAWSQVKKRLSKAGVKL